MEDVIALYERPYDKDYPVVCMDESCKQLVGEVHEGMPCAPGRPARVDHEYVRNGVAEIFLEVEPLTGYTPKHGSWLDMAEIELSALNQQCLDRRIPDLPTMHSQIAAWEQHRNNRQPRIHWHFSTADARTKLKHLYPKL